MAQRISGVARWTAWLGAVSAVLFVCGPVLAHVRVLRAMMGFLLFGLGGLVGIIATILGVLALIRGGGRHAVWGIVLGGIVAVCFISTAVGARKYPPINDITTSFEQPPQFIAAAAETENLGRNMDYPGDAFAQQQQAAYPDLTGLALADLPDAAYQRALRAAEAMPGWQITRLDPAQGALEGVDTTWLFRFQDDFVIEVHPHEGGSIVEMRSKSRDGKGDIGANARRIQTFFARLK